MTDSPLLDLHRLVWTALMAALIGAGAYLIVPIGPVPVSLQTLFIFLAGYTLGPRHGVLAVALYLLAGIVGLPVFAGGTSGLGHLLGPTGGFLFGFVLAALLCGLARPAQGKLVPWGRGLLFGVLAIIALYALGVARLKAVLDFTWAKAMAVGMIPFIPWAAVKIVVALACCRYLARLNLLPGQR
ncbi:MAG: biotin transporter BioY [Desulfovibrionaceae bacterium]|nr:biotin transporter BioY [Desulfovibrionaceae bacterium]